MKPQTDKAWAAIEPLLPTPGRRSVPCSVTRHSGPGASKIGRELGPDLVLTILHQRFAGQSLEVWS